jgi:hypothetical protein
LEYIGDDDMEQLLARNIETYNATKTFPEIDPIVSSNGIKAIIKL